MFLTYWFIVSMVFNEGTSGVVFISFNPKGAFLTSLKIAMFYYIRLILGISVNAVAFVSPTSVCTSEGQGQRPNGLMAVEGVLSRGNRMRQAWRNKVDWSDIDAN